MKPQRHDTQVVVVGTGAGGAVAGATLAQAGIEVVFVERGRTYDSPDHGTVLDGLERMYANSGITLAMGRPPITLPLGVAVGGSTIINSSTCFRPPRAKVEAWGGPSVEEMDSWCERVERRIGAAPADIEVLGPNWTVMKTGCDAVGVEIKPLVHNITGCKRRGRCQFGCPTGAKNSVDRNFIPDALASGARLLTGHRVDRLLLEDERVVGVAGVCAEGRFEVRAKAVVLAMGALATPALLLRRDLANRSGRVGEGLRVHPACRVVAEMPEVVEGWRGLPQGAYIDHWADRGVMLEGIFTPPGPLLASLPGTGFEWKALAAKYPHLSAFGVMVSDTSVGCVAPGLFGAPFRAWYQLNRRDADTMRFGVARVAEIFFAAGAKRVFTSIHPMPVLECVDDLTRFEAIRVKPSGIEAMAFHPLGTCAMGPNRHKAVVDFDLRTHDLDDLYIMDASVIPDSLGVNPQVTIMALAMRAASRLAEKLG